MKKTRIVATVGPASDSKENMIKIVEAGVNVFRLNFSHGTQESHKKIIDNAVPPTSFDLVPLPLQGGVQTNYTIAG